MAQRMAARVRARDRSLGFCLKARAGFAATMYVRVRVAKHTKVGFCLVFKARIP